MSGYNCEERFGGFEVFEETLGNGLVRIGLDHGMHRPGTPVVQRKAEALQPRLKAIFQGRKGVIRHVGPRELVFHNVGDREAGAQTER